MSTVDTAPAASALELTNANPALFIMRDKNSPTAVTVPGSSNFELTLFDITATGTVKAGVPGTLTLTLYGIDKANAQSAPTDPNEWLPISSSVAEPIGGEGELKETMWMIQGKDLMIFMGSGKMQGTFQSNVADNPLPPVNLEQHPGDITDTDPLYVFAVGASFTPTEPPAKLGRAGDDPILCTVELVRFTMSA